MISNLQILVSENRQTEKVQDGGFWRYMCNFLINFVIFYLGSTQQTYKNITNICLMYIVYLIINITKADTNNYLLHTPGSKGVRLFRNYLLLKMHFICIL